MRQYIKYIIVFPFTFVSSVVMAAACCGGNAGNVGVITGDERASLSGSVQISETTHSVSADGWWTKLQNESRKSVLKLDYTQIFSDRFQVGASVPMASSDTHPLGLSDVSALVGYEALPEWDYDPYTPHGVVYVSAKMPTGTSIYDDDEELQKNPTGKGFWAFGAGIVLNKTWGPWDASMGVEARRSLNRTVHNSLLNGEVQPGNGLQWSLGGGWNRGPVRIGASVATNYEDPIRVTGTIESNGSPQRVTTMTLSMGYLLATNLTLTGSYFDQSILGDPVNTNLDTGVSIAIQKRYSR